MYETILVPTDGSEPADRAADHALAVARNHDATVHALFVVDSTAGAEAWGDFVGVPAGDEGAKSVLRERGREVVESVADRADRRGIDAVTAVREGRPHDAILEYVEGIDADLVVMGTHGRDGVRRFLMGSVTEAVVRGATVPVLCITDDQSRRIDGPEAARAAARRALGRRGHDEVSFPAEPSRQRNSWVVTAEADGQRYNVHVSPTGETSVAAIDGRTP